jgi:hypothetical protein
VPQPGGDFVPSRLSQACGRIESIAAVRNDKLCSVAGSHNPGGAQGVPCGGKRAAGAIIVQLPNRIAAATGSLIYRHTGGNLSLYPTGSGGGRPVDQARGSIVRDTKREIFARRAGARRRFIQASERQEEEERNRQ